MIALGWVIGDQERGVWHHNNGRKALAYASPRTARLTEDLSKANKYSTLSRARTALGRIRLRGLKVYRVYASLEEIPEDA